MTGKSDRIEFELWGSLLRPDLYGPFVEVEWKDCYESREKYLESVVEWEKKHLPADELPKDS